MKVRIFSLVIITLLLSAGAWARPITHEDVWTFRRIGAPKVSPDGKWAVFSVTEPSYDKDKQVSDLWLVPTDGSKQPRRLTSTAGSEGGVAWSKAGDKIVFTAKRGKDEARQLYLLNMTGPGEAQRVSNFPLSCRSPKFTPDGKQIVFEALVFPGDTDAESQKKAKKKDEERKEHVSAYEGFPIRYWDHWLDGKHPRPYLLTIGSETAPRDLLKGQEMVQKPGFAGVSGLSGESLQSTISPDGKSLVFIATINRDQAVRADTRYRAYSIPLSGGTVKELPAPEGSVYDPTFGPEGQLFTLFEPHNEWVYNLVDLRVQQWPPVGPGQSLTQGSDLSIDEFTVDKAGRVTVAAKTNGRKRLFSVHKPGRLKPLDPNSRGVFSGISYAGKQIVGRYEDGSTPIEIVKVSENGQVKRLSNFNQPRAKDLDWQPFEEFTFASEKGRKIHNWVVLPPNYSPEKKYPLVLFIHG